MKMLHGRIIISLRPCFLILLLILEDKDALQGRDYHDLGLTLSSYNYRVEATAQIRRRLMRLEGEDAATSSMCKTSTGHIDLTNSTEEREAERIIGIFLTSSPRSLSSSSFLISLILLLQIKDSSMETSKL